MFPLNSKERVTLVLLLSHFFGSLTAKEIVRNSDLFASSKNTFQYQKSPKNKLEHNWIIEEENWPSNATLNNLKQIAGIAATNERSVYIFHRGDNIWDESSFDAKHIYQHQNRGPITQDAVSLLNSTDGSILNSGGSNRFYLPHGISVDPEGNVWLTDVALHQVFRFKKGNWNKPDLILGKAFSPGNDFKHFCKPTDVAISSTGIAYISDGYCNSRILIVDPEGRVRGEFATQDGLMVPHSLTLLENEDLICVADRENTRILCYSAGLSGAPPGKLTFAIRHPLLGRVFAIDHLGDILFAVNGPDGGEITGIALDLASEKLVSVWFPKDGFVFPHDISISPEERVLYVSEIGRDASRKLHKFQLK